jgi:hypothetical protein
MCHMLSRSMPAHLAYRNREGYQSSWKSVITGAIAHEVFHNTYVAVNLEGDHARVDDDRVRDGLYPQCLISNPMIDYRHLR